MEVQLPKVWGKSLYEKFWNLLDKREKWDFGSTKLLSFFPGTHYFIFCYRNVTSNTEMLTDLRFIGGRLVTSFIWWRHSYDDVTHLLKVNFFVICLSPEFLPVSGPLTHLAQPWCVALGRALDSGLISRWVWGLCQLGSSSMPGWTSQITYYYLQVTGL